MEGIVVKNSSFRGISESVALFLAENHLKNRETLRHFVDVFRKHPDGENEGWRGEYWGKVMRGAVLVYSQLRDEELYSVLTESVEELLSVAEGDGRVSSYSREKELASWDVWCRKYVMLGCQYYLGICRDGELRERIVAFLVRHANCIIDGLAEKNIPITRASGMWRGLNSSSILEPMLYLYRLTGDKKYFDFATDIVKRGGAEEIPVFELAYENRLYPYQYGVSKAYEMTSCFEGLLEYYNITGEEKYRTAVVNYAYALLDSEISVIGSAGITHELFDHTSARQTSFYDGVMQETCVTVTLMKFFSRVLALTGDSAFADVIERAYFNAYLGALNTGHAECDFLRRRNPDKTVLETDLPFDSYCPLTAGKRGQMTGGAQLLEYGGYYGCCAAIGAAGVGIYTRNAVTASAETVTVNFFEKCKYELSYLGKNITLSIDTDYPLSGSIKLHVKADSPVKFTLRLRNPGYTDLPKGYTAYTREWLDDTLTVDIPMPVKLHYPKVWDEDVIYTDSPDVPLFVTVKAKTVKQTEAQRKFVAVTRGPITLAADERCGKAPDSIFPIPEGGVPVAPGILMEGDCLLKLRFNPKNAEPFYLVDYASAGKDWRSTIAAWLPIE